jgi:2-hydroxy-6-oxonona-2,4-dienedioate hydrolase
MMSYQPQTEAATSRFLNVEEGGETLRIHFNDCGEGETVVLLHGSGPGATGWANFSRNIDPLVEAGYRVILLDCPGWGKAIRSSTRLAFRPERPGAEKRD